MPQCTIDIPEKLNEKIQLFQFNNKIKRKTEAIIKMLEGLK